MCIRDSAKGANFERLWCQQARDSGAIFAGRFAGSHGILDVVAVYPDKIIFAQLKTGSAVVAAEDRRKIQSFADRMKESRMPVSVRLYTKKARVPVKVHFYSEV